MSWRIAILAALPSELKPLVRGWKRESAPRLVSMWSHIDQDGTEIIAACAGMGANAVTRAFAAVEQQGLDLVISIGLAGATDSSAKVGEVSVVTDVIDVKTGERFPLIDGDRMLRLATVPSAADAAEKARLHAAYDAPLVDMEAATVARLALMRKIPMCCFKAVSDGPDAVLPDIGRFVDQEGQLHTLRFVAYLALRPKYWKAVAALARGSRLASIALTEDLALFLKHKDWEYTNRTGNFQK